IVGWVALQREAMGFGDVTLLAMIGSFLGWQPCVFIFFLSPCVGIVFALTQWVLTGRKEIAFGPYLCIATLIVIVDWPAAWKMGFLYFQIPWLLPALLAISMVLMLGLLMCWRIVEQAVFTRR